MILLKAIIGGLIWFGLIMFIVKWFQITTN